MTRQSFQKGMAILQAAYPGFIDEKTRTVTLDVYWKFLCEVCDERFGMGIKKHIREKKNFPAIAEILEACEFDLKEADALDAWGEVIEQIGTVGSYGTPKFSSPETMNVVQSIGGWKMLCMTETAKIGIQREAFLKAFRILRARENGLRALSEAEKDLLFHGFPGKLVEGWNGPEKT